MMVARLVAIQDDGTQVEITEGVQITYDLLRQSLDWGSGFLDTQEVATVMLLADACGFPDFEDYITDTIREEQWGRQAQALREKYGLDTGPYDRDRASQFQEEWGVLFTQRSEYQPTAEEREAVIHRLREQAQQD